MWIISSFLVREDEKPVKSFKWLIIKCHNDFIQTTLKNITLKKEEIKDKLAGVVSSVCRLSEHITR